MLRAPSANAGCKVSIGSLIAHHVKERDHRVGALAEANGSGVALREPKTARKIRRERRRF